jgi:2-aminoadipate transaminase
MNIESILSSRTKRITSSAIREILKLAVLPGMISLGGGLPSPESFPMDLIRELLHLVMDKYKTTAFQYDMTEGFTPLREALVKYLAGIGISAKVDHIYISSGSQGFLDSIGKLLISPGDYIAMEGPTYLAALQTFNAYQANYIQIETDEHGLIPESLEKNIKSQPIKFVYAIPTFQNPSGKTIPLQRRHEIARIIQHYETLLIEDDPYSQLRYQGNHLPTLKQLAPDHVIYVSSFSKILAPGLRVGFYVAPPEIGRWLVKIKQGVDLNTSTLSQAIAAEYLLGGHLPGQIQKIIDLYRPKCIQMLDSLAKFLPDDFTCSHPEGGMFIWVQGPKKYNIEAALEKSLTQGVGFVPGKFFFPTIQDGEGTIRLNFTSPKLEEIPHAIQIIGTILKEQNTNHYKGVVNG